MTQQPDNNNLKARPVNKEITYTFMAILSDRQDIGVSIVTHRTDPGQLLEAIQCVLRSPRVDKLWVVDNSPDESLRHFAERIGDSRAVYVHVPNRGFGAGHNVAVRQSLAAGFRYHLVMNADVRWTGDVASRMARYMDANPRVGLSMPKVFYPDGTLQYSCRRLPAPLDLFAKRFLPPRLTKKRMRRYLLADASHKVAFNCPYLLGSFLFFRCEALRDAGLFDERFFMYPEDIDITRRIHRSWLTMFWPGAEIIHDHAAASRRSMKMLRIHMMNMARYFCKWGWICDRERRDFNRRLEQSLSPRDADEPDGRG